MTPRSDNELQSFRCTRMRAALNGAPPLMIMGFGHYPTTVPLPAEPEPLTTEQVMARAGIPLRPRRVTRRVPRAPPAAASSSSDDDDSSSGASPAAPPPRTPPSAAASSPSSDGLPGSSPVPIYTLSSPDLDADGSSVNSRGSSRPPSPIHSPSFIGASGGYDQTAGPSSDSSESPDESEAGMRGSSAYQGDENDDDGSGGGTSGSSNSSVDAPSGNSPNGNDDDPSGSSSDDDPQPVGNSNAQPSASASSQPALLISFSSYGSSSESDTHSPNTPIIASNVPTNAQNLMPNSGPLFLIGQGASESASATFDLDIGNNNRASHTGPPMTLYRATVVDGFSTRGDGLGTRQTRPADLMLPNSDNIGVVVPLNYLSQSDDGPVHDIILPFSSSDDSEDEDDSTQNAQRPGPSFDTSHNCSGNSRSRRRSDTHDEDDVYDTNTKRRRLSTSSNANDQTSTTTQPSTEVTSGPQNSLTSIFNPEHCLGKRRHSDNDDYSDAHGTKRRCILATSGVAVRASTTTGTSMVVSQEPQSSHTSTSNSPSLFINSPTDSIVSASACMTTPGFYGLVSGGASPLILPHFDHEIPDLYHSGTRPRPHYDWCHAEWQKAWSQYFKAEELLAEAAANPESYLEKMGVDICQDYMGVLMQGSGWEVLAPGLQPPAGGSLRLHPTRIAKHKLALAQLALAEE
ncbi:srp40-suppressor of mutant ac40 of rna polymerase i iii [Fusarium heterosporum]|uniref:Srp40-suppressor of mutant ac40 of rna polymerase i iii n=1 Tax=Fusarium heterosporum TaxID=42747 RepID=A0A8H5X0G6_FUSHE|nr:srp40-suppressor of mutant ac40 of rna polymerase i iii [Fusarium heterosporum]